MHRPLSSHRLISLVLVAVVGTLLDTAGLAQETKTLWVAHHRVDCIGVARQRCYLIKEDQYEDWKFWYGDIAGFDYEEGYAYEIRVIERRIENPPADAPAIELELVEVLLRIETDQAVAPSAPAPATPPPAAPPPAPAPAATRPESQASEHRGHLTIGTGIETRSFKLCGADESIWVEDRTGGQLWSTYSELAAYPNRPVFMVVRGRLTAAPAGGFGAHYGQQLLVEELRHAATESAGCFDQPDEYAFRASGNEPSWNLTISRRGLVLTEMGVEGRTLFPHSPPTFLDRRIIYRSQTGGNTPRTLIVRLQEATCRDTMADADFSFQATLEIDDRTLTGCAAEGSAEP